MADSSIPITAGTGTNVDTRTEAAGQHRQVIVLGDPSSTDAVAAVQATDPASNTEGVVVRDVNTSAIVSGLRDVRVQSIVDGTIGVENITRVRNVVDGTLTTVTGVDRVRNVVDGTLSVVTFVPAVQRVQNLIDGTLSTVTGVDRVRNVVDGTLSLVTMTQRVNNVIDGTLATVVRVTNLIDGTVRVGNITGSTLQVNVGTIAGTTAVYLHSTAGTIVTKLARESAGIGTDDAAFTIGTGTGTPIMGLADSASQDSVDEDDVGVLRMTTNRLLMTNIQATAGIFTVTGSTSGGTTSGVTLVAPSANYNFKVFAYSLQTTGIVSERWRFTNGAGSETELWRPLVTAAETTSTPKGANMSVSPPAYLFATGTSTTLALKSDTGSLVHYSVSYIKESA